MGGIRGRLGKSSNIEYGRIYLLYLTLFIDYVEMLFIFFGKIIFNLYIFNFNI